MRSMRTQFYVLFFPLIIDPQSLQFSKTAVLDCQTTLHHQTPTHGILPPPSSHVRFSFVSFSSTSPPSSVQLKINYDPSFSGAVVGLSGGWRVSESSVILSPFILCQSPPYRPSRINELLLKCIAGSVVRGRYMGGGIGRSSSPFYIQLYY